MRILLTGSSGQVGSEFLRRLRAMPAGLDVIAPVRGQLDLTDADALRTAVREARPDLIIHPAPYTAVVPSPGAPASLPRSTGLTTVTRSSDQISPRPSSSWVFGWGGVTEFVAVYL